MRAFSFLVNFGPVPDRRSEAHRVQVQVGSKTCGVLNEIVISRK